MVKSSSSSLFDHKMGLKKGLWKPEEDQKLLAYIQQHGHGSWRSLPSKAGLQRCGKSCRLRWTNYLRPDIKRGKFTQHEEQTIIQLHALLGNRWSTIANHLPKRTDNEIKNFWNTHLKKKLTKMGIDPTTHKPKNHPFIISEGQSKDVARLSHMAQWESARLEAEARLVRQSKLGISSNAYKYYNENFLNKCANYTSHPLAVTPPPPRPVLCLDVLKAWASTNSRRNNNNNNIPFNGFFHDLESPTPILFKFPEEMRNPSCRLLCENVLGNGDFRSQDGIEGVTKNSPMDQLRRVITPPNVETDTMHHVAGESLGFQSFVEGFDDVRFISNSVNAGYYNGVEGCVGVYEDNKSNNYWASPMLMLEEM